VPLLCFAFHPGILIALAVLFVSGLGAALYLGLDRLVLQLAPEDLLSRTLSIEAAGVMFWQGIGYAIAGGAAQVVRPTVVIPVAAACGLLVTAWYAVTLGAEQARVRPAPG
jgi:hypothetical protein